ncbi:MAG: MBL fold metallo-hydrolase [Deltaproteobacteria bacterium]|nr:MBL fold metallo-hydrolase [Deltaproteobacteria bacterium]
MVKVRWLGAAGIEFTHEGDSWLLDPYFSRWGKLKVLLGRVAPKKAAIETALASLNGELRAIIVSHTHFDHALDVPEIAQRFEGPILGGASLNTLFDRYGRGGRVTVCAGGESIDLPGGARVTMLTSLHGKALFNKVPYPGEIEPGGAPPVKAAEYRHGQNFICMFEVGGTTFAHSGSANLIDESLMGRRCDVLFMCLPFWQNTPDYHRRLVGALKPKVVIPFHFDDFSKPFKPDGSAPDLPLLKRREFMDRLREAAPDTRVIIPRTNQIMDF